MGRTLPSAVAGAIGVGIESTLAPPPPAGPRRRRPVGGERGDGAHRPRRWRPPWCPRPPSYLAAPLGERLARPTAGTAVPVELDALALLGERAAIAGFHPPRSTHLRRRLPAAGDPRRLVGGVARPARRTCRPIPAWRASTDRGGRWAARSTAEFARTVGGSRARRGRARGLRRSCFGPGPPAAPRVVGPPGRRRRRRPVVAVGGSAVRPLLGPPGARVIKVESVRSARRCPLGPRAFFDLLNAGNESVALDLADPAGRRALRALLARADVVIEARAQGAGPAGLDAEAEVARRPVVWVSITGYGAGAGAANGVRRRRRRRRRPRRPRLARRARASAPMRSPTRSPDWLRPAPPSTVLPGGRWLLDCRWRRPRQPVPGPRREVRPRAIAVAVSPAARAAPAPSLGADTDAVLARTSERRHFFLARNVEVDRPRRRCAGRERVLITKIGRDSPVGRRFPTPTRPSAGSGGALIPGLHDHHIHLLARAAARRSITLPTRT